MEEGKEAHECRNVQSPAMLINATSFPHFSPAATYKLPTYHYI